MDTIHEYFPQTSGSPNKIHYPDSSKTDLNFFKPLVQPKPASPSGTLTINSPEDIYEQQANKVAEQVVQMKENNITPFFMPNGKTGIPALQKKCAACEGEEKEHAQLKKINTQANSDSGGEIEGYASNLHIGGQSLPDQALSFYGPRFGYDFSNVKIHTDSAAAKSAQSINALAYTSGNNIVFNNGQYSPDTEGGKKLLAHELTHVVQQSNGLHPKMIQRQVEITCSIDAVKLARLLAGDKSVALEVLDCCEKGLDPLPKGCTSDLVGLAKKILGLGKGKGDEKNDCSKIKDFRPSRTRKGECCRSEIESDRDCCPPGRITRNSLFPRCCNENEIPDGDQCVNVPDKPKPVTCPDDQPPSLSGKCCVPPKVNKGGICADPSIPPVPPQPKLRIEKTSAIGFRKDAPQSWYAPSSSFGVSATPDGKTNFDELVIFLKQNPDLNIQVEGHASSEKPANDSGYNQRLTDRRVEVLSKELQKKGIDTGSRLQNIPDDPDVGGCVELSSGLMSCGDSQAQSTVEASDRNVTVKVFQIK